MIVFFALVLIALPVFGIIGSVIGGVVTFPLVLLFHGLRAGLRALSGRLTT